MCARCAAQRDGAKNAPLQVVDEYRPAPRIQVKCHKQLDHEKFFAIDETFSRGLAPTQYGEHGKVAVPVGIGPSGLTYLEFQMTNRSRIAAFLSVSALTLGLSAAPAAFAADAAGTTAKPAAKTAHPHKHKAKSGNMSKTTTPAR
jgi:hypothetical protein